MHIYISVFLFLVVMQASTEETQQGAPSAVAFCFLFVVLLPKPNGVLTFLART
jgi:hypothetical protein